MVSFGPFPPDSTLYDLVLGHAAELCPFGACDDDSAHFLPRRMTGLSGDCASRVVSIPSYPILIDLVFALGVHQALVSPLQNAILLPTGLGRTDCEATSNLRGRKVNSLPWLASDISC
ncbi:hypothetical protein LWI29_032549 [Acer saccharum]|uniref:Uncharacterized protein n=1 Tax=Acer saccharum TaxID=4024 RepID=A0AA39SPP3_ACESA|nr:hypothetical protein LWI29_032549 [Acer saccharum]